MSRFICNGLARISEYVPGEQPRDKKYIKLNTNESPFAPSPAVIAAAAKAAEGLNLYSDPEQNELTAVCAKYLGVRSEEVLMTNGSDEILNYAFAAYGDKDAPFVFPSLTYGFYKVFADLYNVPFREIPLKKDLSIDIKDYFDTGANIAIANPNAPTGLLLSVKDIEQIVCKNPSRVVIIDEAYIDFGGKSCVRLINKYDNLLVTRTFSKSFSLAGGRLGMGVASEELIKDLKKVKYSTNPYNVNSMTAAAGIAALKDADYYLSNCRVIAENRDMSGAALKKLGFNVTDSSANFLFVSHPLIGGKDYYLKLKERGILVRHFDKAGASEYVRITVGTAEQMQKLIKATEEILALNGGGKAENI